MMLWLLSGRTHSSHFYLFLILEKLYPTYFRAFLLWLLAISYFQYLTLYFPTHYPLRSREINIDLLISLSDKLWFVHQHHLKCYDSWEHMHRKKARGMSEFCEMQLTKPKGFTKHKIVTLWASEFWHLRWFLLNVFVVEDELPSLRAQFLSCWNDSW